jgi:outer membrane receptor protein involved in Fe transport
LNSDFLLLLSPTLSSEIDFTATLGHNYFSQNSFTNQQSGIGLGQPGFFNIANASNITSFQNWNRKRKIAGIFADVKVGYRETVYLNLSGRNDWTSTLNKENNAFFYPSASLGFIFTELMEVADNPIFSYGKLRASWGKVGNDAPVFSTTTLYPSYTVAGDGFIAGLTAPLFGLPAYERAGARGNPDLKPEFTTTTEIGGEFRFWRNRINLDVTYYNSLTEDAIINVTVPSSTGHTSQQANAAKIENKGWEVALSGTVVESGFFNWTVDVNFNKYTNIVRELAPGVELVGLAGFTTTSSNAVAGQPYGVIFGSRWERDPQGRVYIDDNGWPIRSSTAGPIGNPNPDWTGGMRNTFSWKGISLSALVDVRQGGDIWQGTVGIMNYFGTSQLSAEQRTIKDFVFEGIRKSDEQVNTTPVDLYPDPATSGDLWPSNANALNSIYWVRYEFGGVSEQSIFDSSWIRLRDVTIAYSVPPSLLGNGFVKGVNISLTGRNLWLKTDAPGIDPETNLTGATNGIGLEYFNMPNTRSYGASVQLTF